MQTLGCGTFSATALVGLVTLVFDLLTPKWLHVLYTRTLLSF